MKTMKFDAVVGNPPYQLETGSTSRQATPIYNIFVEQAKALSPRYLSMIMPSRWFAGGMGLDQFRSNMMHDSHISKIVDYVNAKDCFPQISISGGVCYFCLLYTSHPPGADLQGGCCMRILEELWYGNIEPTEYDTIACKEYKEVLRLITRNEEKLLATMTDEQKELFSRYTDAVQEYQTMAECLLFQSSFKLGAKMMIEVMDDR